ncbi:uncharacterized protein LOC144145884 [Haemaphysalis longicornis]
MESGSAAAIPVFAKGGRPRLFTPDEIRQRKNAAKRAKRLAVKSTVAVISPSARRAQRAAAQRARRQNEAIRKREAEADREAKRLKRRFNAMQYRPNHCVAGLLEPSSAAKYASSKTGSSFSAGKGNSLTQCGVPVVFKSSQADFKPRSRSVGVQTQHGRKIPAGLTRRKGAAAGTSAVRRSRPEAADIALRLWEELQSRHLATTT